MITTRCCFITLHNVISLLLLVSTKNCFIFTNEPSDSCTYELQERTLLFSSDIYKQLFMITRLKATVSSTDNPNFRIISSSVTVPIPKYVIKESFKLLRILNLLKSSQNFITICDE